MPFFCPLTTDQVIGSSSNHALFRNVSQGFSQLARRSRLTAPNRPRDSVEGFTPKQADSDHCRPSSARPAHSLPPQDELMSLLVRFFATVGAVIPCFDEVALLEYWREPRKNGTRVIPRSTYALVNIMMAHASATLPNGDPILFYRRASDLLDMPTVQGTGVSTGRLLSQTSL